MSKHTPGPWKFSSGVFNSADSRPIIYAGKPADMVQICRADEPNGHDEAVANGRLIAAAPQLLAIAKAYRNLLRASAHTDGEVATFHHIESVLAKAEGQEGKGE